MNETFRKRTGPASFFLRNSWIFTEVLNITELALALWVFVALLMHSIRNNKVNRRDKKTATMFTLAILCPLTLMLRLLVTQALVIIERLFSLGGGGSLVCEVVIDASVIMFSVSMSPVYYFLWHR